MDSHGIGLFPRLHSCQWRFFMRTVWIVQSDDGRVIYVSEKHSSYTRNKIWMIFQVDSIRRQYKTSTHFDITSRGLFVLPLHEQRTYVLQQGKISAGSCLKPYGLTVPLFSVMLLI